MGGGIPGCGGGGGGGPGGGAPAAAVVVTVQLVARYEPARGLVCRNEATFHLAATYEAAVDLTAGV
jgi:hypothetical protein